MKEKSKKIVRIALTGGPCAGKTSALAYLTRKLSDIGFYPVIIPEAATILINAGANPKVIGVTLFQRRVFEMIMSLEDVFTRAAHDVPNSNVVIIHDRGIPDGRAYIMDSEFERLLAEYDKTIPEIRDERYDAVFHLRTAALGAEAFYANVNNAARYESPEEARTVDEKILHAWVGHPHLRILDNSTPFEEKLKRLFREVCVVLGVPAPLEIERKFLIKPFKVSEHVLLYQEIDIEQAYLKSVQTDEEVRIRKRGQNGSFIYYRTEKKTLSSGVRMEREEQIDKDRYVNELEEKLSGTRIIKKKRTCFVFNEMYFEYDRFEDPAGIHILEIELTDRNQNIELPPYIEVIREVTGDPSYSNAVLARESSIVQ